MFWYLLSCSLILLYNVFNLFREMEIMNSWRMLYLMTTFSTGYARYILICWGWRFLQCDMKRSKYKATTICWQEEQGFCSTNQNGHVTNTNPNMPGWNKRTFATCYLCLPQRCQRIFLGKSLFSMIWHTGFVQSEAELLAEKRCVAHLTGEVSILVRISWIHALCLSAGYMFMYTNTFFSFPGYCCLWSTGRYNASWRNVEVISNTYLFNNWLDSY